MARRIPVYAYEFADRHAPVPFDFPLGFPPGAAHASELPYPFDLPGLTAG